MNRRNYNLQTLLVLALGSEISYIVIASFGNLRNHIPAYLACYGVVFAIYWISALTFFDFRVVKQNEHDSPSSASNLIKEGQWLRSFLNFKNQDALSTKEIVSIGIIFGVVFRATLLLTTPSLSDDIYRYLWDGRVASHGINPFEYSPDAEEISSLRDQEIYPKVNHKEISTIYPPVNQLIYWGLYKVKPTVLAFKTAFFCFDVLTIGVLLLLLKRLSIRLTRVLIYVWNPLVIIEFAGSGHADIIGVFFLTVSLWLLVEKRIQWANLALVFSFLNKFISILILPVIAYCKRQSKIMVALVFVLITALLYLPYADAEAKLFSGLSVYSSKWQFNGSIFEVVLTTVKRLLPESWIIKYMVTPYGYAPDAETIASRGTDLALIIAKIIIVLVFCGIFFYYMKRLRNDLSRHGDRWVFKIGVILLGWFFLLNPTVQPWYLCWLLPFLIVAPNRAWILLTGFVGLSYWILIDYTRDGVWQESAWVLWVEYLPFFALLIYDALKATTSRHRQFESAET